jgi:fructoselysine and glucoselysine-specific PTS system IID component
MKTSNEKMFTKKDMTKMAVNAGALGMEYSWNYPRQMHLAFCMMIEKCLRKIYKDDPEGYAAALTRHVAFFNITPQLAPFVGGIAVSMEEKVATGELEGTAVDSVKAALMGPLSGIGDSIFLGCIRVIAVAVGASLAATGNVLGPILYFLIYNIPAFLVRIFGARLGYDLGFSFLTNAQKSGLMDKIMYAAGIVGTMVIGAMSSDMFWATLPTKIGSGDSATTLQKILDGIMPGMLGIAALGIYYWLLKKKVNPMILIIGTMILGIAGAFFGFLA